MDNYTLSKTQKLKYRGVILDHKVSWIQHISYVKNKISKGIGIMYKARRYLRSKSLVNLYHSYIYIYIYIYIFYIYIYIPILFIILIGDIQIFPIDLLIMLVHVYGTLY